jgi:hypothetical protein
MPQLNAPPAAQALTERSGQVSLGWAQWFTQLWRTVVPERAFYIPTTDGAPAFTPEARAGFAPMTFDPATGILYIHDESNWLSTTLT